MSKYESCEIFCYISIAFLFLHSTHSNNRVPNFTISEESIFSVILGASEKELSVKPEEDPHPRMHLGRGALRISTTAKIYLFSLSFVNKLLYSDISNPALYVSSFKNIVNN